METKKLLTAIEGTITELLQVISSFDREQINVIPFEGSWTAGQVAQHLVMSHSGFLEMINGPVKETEKKPDELVEKIKKDFLDFNTKMKSPDFVVPPETSYAKQDLLRSLQDIKGKIIQAITSLDLTKTCLAFEVPQTGFLTRLEAVSFILYHSQRHIHQLKNIYQKVVNREGVMSGG